MFANAVAFATFRNPKNSRSFHSVTYLLRITVVFPRRLPRMYRSEERNGTGSNVKSWSLIIRDRSSDEVSSDGSSG